VHEANLQEQGFFCDGARRYGVWGNENHESIACMSLLY